jgi:hypothetical protein
MGQMSGKYQERKAIRRIIVLFAAVVCLCFLGIGSALADYSLTLQSAGSDSYGGVYVGPYQISVNGKPSTPMICDDYSTHIDTGDNWNAKAYTWSHLKDMKFYGNASFGGDLLNASAAQAYKEVFYLSAEMMLQPNNSEYAAIHYAIWQIMDPKDNPGNNGPTGSGPTSTAYWLTKAAANYTFVNTKDFIVYTPCPANTSQEFIKVICPHNAIVPVPPSLLFLGCGLLGVAGLRKRPRK